VSFTIDACQCIRRVPGHMVFQYFGLKINELPFYFSRVKSSKYRTFSHSITFWLVLLAPPRLSVFLCACCEDFYGKVEPHPSLYPSKVYLSSRCPIALRSLADWTMAQTGSYLLAKLSLDLYYWEKPFFCSTYRNIVLYLHKTIVFELSIMVRCEGRSCELQDLQFGSSIFL